MHHYWWPAVHGLYLGILKSFAGLGVGLVGGLFQNEPERSTHNTEPHDSMSAAEWQAYSANQEGQPWWWCGAGGSSQASVGLGTVLCIKRVCSTGTRRQAVEHTTPSNAPYACSSRPPGAQGCLHACAGCPAKGRTDAHVRGPCVCTQHTDPQTHRPTAATVCQTPPLPCAGQHTRSGARLPGKPRL